MTCLAITTWLEKVLGAKRSQLGRPLRALPLALEVETSLGPVGLVHADCPFDDWYEMQQIAWSRIDHTSTVADYCLWSRERPTNQGVVGSNPDSRTTIKDLDPQSQVICVTAGPLRDPFSEASAKIPSGRRTS